MNRYDITDVNDYVDAQIYTWLKETLTEDQYTIVNLGFLIDHYYVKFNDPAAETMYLLVWS